MKDPYARANNACLIFLTIVCATIALAYMQPVLIPLVFSIFTYSVLTPLVDTIEKKTKAPKPLAIFFALSLLFIGLTIVVIVLVNSIEGFVQGAPKYKASLVDAIDYIQVQMAIFDFQFDFNKVQETIQTLPLLSYASGLTGQLLAILGNLFLIFIFTVFMMSGKSRGNSKHPLVAEILTKVSSYVSSKFSLSLATGFLIWILLLAFNVELAFIFGLLTVLLNFIPTIGSIVAIVLPVPVVLLQYQLGWQFFVILSLSGVIQFTIGNVIEPKIMGDSMDLHPITVMICLVFWGMIWGIAGMFLAVPITAVLKIIFSRIEATKGFSEILAGRIQMPSDL